MTELLLSIILLLVTHWVADFVIQTDWQARNKWNTEIALLAHVGTYTLTMFLLGYLPLMWITGSTLHAVAFLCITNGMSHLVIDSVTSKINHALWEQKQPHYFFVCVGFDQLLHTLCLLACAYLAVKY